MNPEIMQTADLTGASYSAVLFGMIAASAFLLLGTGWVGKSWKLPVALCAVACVVGMVSHYEARATWLAAGQVPIVYHYAGWVVSIPLQVLALYFFVRQVGRVPLALFWRLTVVSVLMILVRYGGESGYIHATLSFLIGIVFWLYILGELYFGQMDQVVAKGGGGAVKRGYFWLRLIVTIGWAVYPLGNFITSFAGFVDDGSLSVTYNAADFLNRIAFGLAVLATALAAEQEQHHA